MQGWRNQIQRRQLHSEHTKFKDNLIEYKYLSAYLGLAILETGENSNVWGLVWLCKTKYSEKLKLCIQTV